MNIKEMEKKAVNKIKEEGLTVSNSRINKWRTCHRAHYYKYVLKLVPKVKGIALTRGSALHECLEYYYSGRSWKKPYRQFKQEFEDMYLREEKEKLGDIPQMVYDLMVGYVNCWEQEDDELDFLKQEMEFTVPLVNDNIRINGFIDFIAEDNKGIIIGETKTHKMFPDYDVRLFNIQSSLYAWVVREYFKEFKKVNRIMWNYIKAKSPTKPRLLKDGKNLSQAKIESLPHVVEAAIKEYGLDPKKYVNLINAQSYNNFYRRDIIRIEDSVVNSVVEDTKNTASQIYNNPLWKDRNINKMNCSYCDYRELCQAELCNPGLDLDYIVKKDFDISEGRSKDNENQEKSKREKFKTKRSRK